MSKEEMLMYIAAVVFAIVIFPVMQAKNEPCNSLNDNFECSHFLRDN